MFTPIYELIQFHQSDPQVENEWTGETFRRNENEKAERNGRRKPFGKRT